MVVAQLAGDTPALLTVAETALTELAADPLAGDVDDGALAATVERLQRLENRVAAEKLRWIAEVDRRSAFLGEGSRSTEDLLAARLAMTRGEAKGQAETARALEVLPRTAGKLAADEMGVGQIEVAARALEDLPKDLPAEDREDVRDELDELIAHDGGDFRLDPVGGATVRSAIEALARPQDATDGRTQAQRNADALVALCEAYLNAGKLPEVAAQRPQLILVSTAEALEGAPGAPAPELDGYGPVSSATARMLACDGEVTDVVVDHLGPPLQVKETGKPTRKQRLGVIARDGRCIGCGAPAARCQLHHVVWQSNGGATVVENTVLARWSCHRRIHHHGWQVVRKGGRHVLRSPAACDPAGRHSP